VNAEALTARFREPGRPALPVLHLGALAALLVLCSVSDLEAQGLLAGGLAQLEGLSLAAPARELVRLSSLILLGFWLLALLLDALAAAGRRPLRFGAELGGELLAWIPALAALLSCALLTTLAVAPGFAWTWLSEHAEELEAAGLASLSMFTVSAALKGTAAGEATPPQERPLTLLAGLSCVALAALLHPTDALGLPAACYLTLGALLIVSLGQARRQLRVFALELTGLANATLLLEIGGRFHDAAELGRLPSALDLATAITLVSLLQLRWSDHADQRALGRRLRAATADQPWFLLSATFGLCALPFAGLLCNPGGSFTTPSSAVNGGLYALCALCVWSALDEQLRYLGQARPRRRALWGVGLALGAALLLGPDPSPWLPGAAHSTLPADLRASLLATRSLGAGFMALCCFDAGCALLVASFGIGELSETNAPRQTLRAWLATALACAILAFGLAPQTKGAPASGGGSVLELALLDLDLEAARERLRRIERASSKPGSVGPRRAATRLRARLELARCERDSARLEALGYGPQTPTALEPLAWLLAAALLALLLIGELSQSHPALSASLSSGSTALALLGLLIAAAARADARLATLQLGVQQQLLIALFVQRLLWLLSVINLRGRRAILELSHARQSRRFLRPAPSASKSWAGHLGPLALVFALALAALEVPGQPRSAAILMSAALVCVTLFGLLRLLHHLDRAPRPTRDESGRPSLGEQLAALALTLGFGLLLLRPDLSIAAGLAALSLAGQRLARAERREAWRAPLFLSGTLFLGLLASP
jgi:hypothetical protein